MGLWIRGGRDGLGLGRGWVGLGLRVEHQVSVRVGDWVGVWDQGGGDG